MSSLFGVELPTPVNFIIAFVVVLLLIGAATWLVRRFGATQLDAAARGRQPRLAVIDAAAVDSRRKLVIIRRDNVEHLLMIGGPTDVVVETNIVRAAASTMTRDAAPARNGTNALPDPSPWPLQPEPVPVSAPAAPALRAERGPRLAVEDDDWPAPAEPMPAHAPAPQPPPIRVAQRPAETLAGLAHELSRPAPPVEPAMSTRIVHPEPAPAPAVAIAPAPAPAASPPVADQSLAEMAQRLEAALRRPMAAKAEGGARVAVAAEAKPSRAPRVVVAQPKGGAAPAPAAAAAAPAAQPSSLEQEMASLLTKPGKS